MVLPIVPIEAARAGEAGKGFAVVASEVKALANQTAKATEEIASQVAAIQGATREAVASIGTIGSTIEEMSGIAQSVAAAAEQQSATTDEIARNVQAAAEGTAEVSTAIAGVSRTADGTGAAAQQVVAAASELARHGDTLRVEVDAFLTAVAASGSRNAGPRREGRPTQNFREMHAELVTLAGEIGARLDPAALAADAGPARSLLSTLIGKLTIHLAMEDKSLYPQLKSHPDPEVRASAERFDAEMAAMAPAVLAFGQRWTEAAIREDAAVFCEETRKLFAVLADRIKRENTQLYDLADRSLAALDRAA